MVSRVLDDPLQGAHFVILFVLLPVALVATALRYIATRHKGRAIGVDDWAAYASTIVYIAYTIASIYSQSPSNVPCQGSRCRLF